MIESALKTIHLDDYFLRYILTCSSINQACYLIMDNLLWLNSIGIVDMKKRADKLNEWSNKFWLYSTILYLARDFHDYLTLIHSTDESGDSGKFDPTRKYKLDEVSGAYKSSGSATVRQRNKSFLKMILRKLRIILLNRKNLPLLLDTIKNISDLFLPLSSLNFVNLSPGMQGICGIISSLISLLIVWDSKYKLTP